MVDRHLAASRAEKQRVRRLFKQIALPAGAMAKKIGEGQPERRGHITLRPEIVQPVMSCSRKERFGHGVEDSVVKTWMAELFDAEDDLLWETFAPHVVSVGEGTVAALFAQAREAGIPSPHWLVLSTEFDLENLPVLDEDQRRERAGDRFLSGGEAMVVSGAPTAAELLLREDWEGWVDYDPHFNPRVQVRAAAAMIWSASGACGVRGTITGD